MILSFSEFVQGKICWLSAIPLIALGVAGNLQAESPAVAPKPAWPEVIGTVRIKSSADGTKQPALFHAPKGSGPVPLLVNLHTWSRNYQSLEPAYAAWCLKNGWAFMRPDFRGANNTPRACMSDLAVQDIVDSVRYAQENANIDPQRIYLVGVSGGGHAALMLAARHPEIWAGVSAWCSISGLAAAHESHVKNGQPDKYAREMEAVCGGAPGASPAVDAEYRKRSPLTWLAGARTVPLDIVVGVRDRHPITQSLDAYNLLAGEKDGISADLAKRMTEDQAVPEEIRWRNEDPFYRRRPVLFRKISGPTRLTIFDGGHEILYEAALAWLGAQRKGQPPIWEIADQVDADISGISAEADK